MVNKTKNTLHWANISEAGQITGMKFLLWIYKVAGRLPFQIVLAPVMLYFFIAKKDARSASRQYWLKIRKLRPEMQGRLLTMQSFLQFWCFANAMVDKLGVCLGKITRDDVCIHGEDIFSGLVERNSGAVLLVSHHGNCEISRCLSSRHKNIKLTMLLHTLHAQKFNKLLQSQTKENHTKLLQVTEITPATAMTLSERTSCGEFIAIAADRTAVNNPSNSLTVNFLKNETQLPIGPFILANLLQVPLIALACIKHNGQYHIYFNNISDNVKISRHSRRKELQIIAQRYADLLQEQTLSAPYQWFNFFNFWDAPSEPT